MFYIHQTPFPFGGLKRDLLFVCMVLDAFMWVPISVWVLINTMWLLCNAYLHGCLFCMNAY